MVKQEEIDELIDLRQHSSNPVERDINFDKRSPDFCDEETCLFTHNQISDALFNI